MFSSGCIFTLNIFALSLSLSPKSFVNGCSSNSSWNKHTKDVPIFNQNLRRLCNVYWSTKNICTRKSSVEIDEREPADCVQNEINKKECKVSFAYSLTGLFYLARCDNPSKVNSSNHQRQQLCGKRQEAKILTARTRARQNKTKNTLLFCDITEEIFYQRYCYYICFDSVSLAHIRYEVFLAACYNLHVCESPVCILFAWAVI